MTFSASQWKRFIRSDLFDEAGLLVRAALGDGAVGVRELRECYQGLSDEYGDVLLLQLGGEVEDGEGFETFLWEVFRDASRPYRHRGTALQRLASRRVPGVESLLVADLRARSEERRFAALTWLARRGRPVSTDAVLDRISTILTKPARSDGGRERRVQHEVVFGVVHVFRCGDTTQLGELASTLRNGSANLSSEERSWLREFWPGCLDRSAAATASPT